MGLEFYKDPCIKKKNWKNVPSKPPKLGGTTNLKSLMSRSGLLRPPWPFPLLIKINSQTHFIKVAINFYASLLLAIHPNIPLGTGRKTTL